MTTRCPLLLIGPHGDSGYLVEDALDGIAACFSPGVPNNSRLKDAACIDRSMRVTVTDYSVDAASLDANVDPQHYVFVKKFIGAVDDNRRLTGIEDIDVAEQRGTKEDDLLLQIDIEGAEFTAISSPRRINCSRGSR